MWQNVGPILQSQADLHSFSLEVSKKLNLRYENPPKPVHLSVSKKNSNDLERGGSDALKDLQQFARVFGKGVAEGDE